jgi:Leucine-rich repeat (LRR) protein
MSTIQNIPSDILQEILTIISYHPPTTPAVFSETQIRERGADLRTQYKKYLNSRQIESLRAPRRNYKQHLARAQNIKFWNRFKVENNALILSYNNISVIPPEIKYLKSLLYLYLDINNISIIPPEIKYLKNLEELSLSNNNISVIPPEIKYLKNIKRIYLFGNKISIIPPEIKYLKNIKYAPLCYNKISIIPPEIKHLKNIKELHLTKNNISIIPPELKYIKIYI